MNDFRSLERVRIEPGPSVCHPQLGGAGFRPELLAPPNSDALKLNSIEPSPTLPAKHLAVLHDERDFLQRGDVVQRVAFHCDDIRQIARFHRADLALPAE